MFLWTIFLFFKIQNSPQIFREAFNFVNKEAFKKFICQLVGFVKVLIDYYLDMKIMNLKNSDSKNKVYWFFK